LAQPLGAIVWPSIRHDQPIKQENIMISFINSRNTVLAFAFAGFASIGMSNFAGQASAGILEECHASSKTKVVACCKQHVERFGRPTWMSNGEDNNCRAAAVKCVAKMSSFTFSAVAVVAKKPYCYLELALQDDRGHSRPSNPPSKNQNGPNIAGKN
jgi:hypothetical protein